MTTEEAVRRVRLGLAHSIGTRAAHHSRQVAAGFREAEADMRARWAREDWERSEDRRYGVNLANAATQMNALGLLNSAAAYGVL